MTACKIVASGATGNQTNIDNVKYNRLCNRKECEYNNIV